MDNVPKSSRVRSWLEGLFFLSLFVVAMIRLPYAMEARKKSREESIKRADERKEMLTQALITTPDGRVIGNVSGLDKTDRVIIYIKE